MPSTSLFPPPSPLLPPFDSLLIKGPYPPSAPIHLCISYLRANEANADNAGKVLFLSPSRQGLASALQDFNDEWLTTDAVKGRHLALLSRIDIYYPPSTAHWLLLLSLFRPLSSSGSGSSSAAPLNKAVLPYTPSLIVLHEPSTYFSLAEGSQSQSPNLSQYLQLITTALSTSSFLSPHDGKAIPLVLFDSSLSELKLPIVRPVTPSRQAGFFQGVSRASGAASPARQERVEKFVEKYFEWIGTVIDEYAEEASKANTPPPPGTFDTPVYERRGPFRLRLDRRVPSDEETQIRHHTIEWSEVRGEKQRYSTIRQTGFVFKTSEER